MARLLKGAPVAEAISERLKARVETLKTSGVNPTLAIIRIGSRPEDMAYERGATKRCAKLGINVVQFLLDRNCTRDKLREVICTVNDRSDIHGCLMFHPIPDREMESEAAHLLVPNKDIDGFTHASLSNIFAGKGDDSFAPCAPKSVMEILAHYEIDLCGKNAVIIGRSAVVGRPMAMLMLGADATVTICHTRTRNIPELCRKADIIVSGAGSMGLITPDCVTDRSIVIDVAINVGPDGKLCGDAEFEKIEPIVNAITPVPGGVGMVTSTVLAKQVVEAAEQVTSKK